MTMAQLSESEFKRLGPIVAALFPDKPDKTELEISSLVGGITNHNLKLSTRRGKGASVVRFFGADSENLGINRQREFECSKEAARISVAPEVLGYFPEQAALATRFVPGKTLTDKDIQHEPMLKRIVGQIRKLHDQTSFPGQFSVFDITRQYRDLSRSHEVELPQETSQAFDHFAQIESALKGREKTGPCHNDLLAANFIDDGQNIWILDWEYSASGNTYFDLANFAVNNQLSADQCEIVVSEYFGEFHESHLAQLELLMIASDLRESFWSFVQVALSSLEFDYGEYARKHFHRFLEAVPKIESCSRQL